MTHPFFTLRTLFGPRRSTPTQRRTLLRLIATSVENRANLPELLRSWSEEEWGWQSLRLRWIAKTLDEGVALPGALERIPNALGDEDTLLVRQGSESGTLASTLRHRLRREAPGRDTPGQVARRGLGYLLLVLVLAAPTAFYLVEVLPGFLSIYSEFSLEPPAVTTFASALTLAPVQLLCLLIAFWLAIEVIRMLRGPTRFLRRVAGPYFFRSWRNRRVASVLERLGESVAAGRPILGSISTLARYHYDPALRHRLLVVRNEVELGTPLWDAMRSARLLTDSESAALAASDVTSTRAWTLATIGEATRKRAESRQQAEAGLLLPAVVLLIGVFVLSQALGVLSALVRLIESLA